MLVEIPDPEVILGIVAAFLGGLFALYVIIKIRPYFNSKKLDASNMQRLEYYERQLIDMKIRLDSLDLVDDSEHYVKVRESPKDSYSTPQVRKSSKTINIKETRMPNMIHSDITGRVLELITERPMTSHDIRITLGRSREHIARLMKKLSQEGLVERNTESKPYSYSISNTGKERLEIRSVQPAAA